MAIALADKVANVVGNQVNSASSISFTLPGGIPANGRLLLATIVADAHGTDVAIATPAGWTLQSTLNAPSNMQAYLFSRVTSNETSATYTFSESGTANNTYIGGVLELWSGINTTTPIVVSSGWVSRGNTGGTAFSSPSESTSAANCVAVSFFSTNDIRQVSAFGWTLAAESGNAGGQYVDVFSSYKTGLATGTGYAESITFTANTYNYPYVFALTLILQPPPAVNTITKTDTGAAVTDEVSMAQTPYPPTAPDTIKISDSPVVAVTHLAGTGGSVVNFVRPFRFGKMK